MPLFTYMCEECRKGCELLARSDDTPACPHCGKNRLVKQASAITPKAGDGGPAGNLPPGCASCVGRREGTCPSM